MKKMTNKNVSQLVTKLDRVLPVLVHSHKSVSKAGVQKVNWILTANDLGLFLFSDYYPFMVPAVFTILITSF